MTPFFFLYQWWFIPCRALGVLNGVEIEHICPHSPRRAGDKVGIYGSEAVVLRRTG